MCVNVYVTLAVLTMFFTTLVAMTTNAITKLLLRQSSALTPVVVIVIKQECSVVLQGQLTPSFSAVRH